jgi:hypothetical protein
MKTNLLTLALFGLLFQIPLFAQERTTVNATSDAISENLDLRAVASIFGEASNLEDFEQRLNDPRNKISNLDLNFDRQVDYLRVIEAVEQNTHLIILQAVLERDVFQDVATIEVERDRNNQVQIQVVGDVFMYGPNYIYEPIYVVRPMIYNIFWVRNYNPYFSPYFFNFYPNYFYAWSPYPIYQYHRNIHVHINTNNFYNYSNNRRSTNAVALHETRRRNGYETSYSSHNASVRNQNSNVRNTRNNTIGTTRNNNSNTRSQNAGQSNTRVNEPANNVRQSGNVRNANTTRKMVTTTPTRANSNDQTRKSVASQQSTSRANQNSMTNRNTAQNSPTNFSSVRSTTPSKRSASSTTRNALTPTRSSASQSKSFARSTRNAASSIRSSAPETSTRSNRR